MSLTGKSITLTIDKLVYKGFGLGKFENWSVFVPGTLPGDTISAIVSYKKRRHIHAKLEQIITPSALRATSGCQHFPACGGCQIMDVSYSEQLKLKHSIITDCFQPDHSDLIPQIAPVLPSPDTSFYRNKMDFAFGSLDGELIIGLKRRGQFDQIIAITQCQLQDPESNAILTWSQKRLQEMGLSPWNSVSHTGLLRHLILRQSKSEGKWMVNLVCSSANPRLEHEYCNALCEQFPSISVMALSINESVSDTSYATNVSIIKGNGKLTEKLGDFSFQISPYAFFQTNSKGAELLYETTKRLADVQKTDTVMDLYCGTGTIGLFLAPHAHKIIGIEENESAVEDAKRNATENKINNCEFHLGRVKNILKFNTFTPDVVVVDPPRAGMVPKALARILELNAAKIIYVSCNPNTLARDLVEMRRAGYTPTHIQPVDMFPNTYHVECITVLRKDGAV
jgi:23S rRNA (uracil1939-C5)-methyltransferase